MGFLDAFKYPVHTIDYEAGLPDIKKPCKTNIIFKDDEVEIKAYESFKPTIVILKPDDIIEVSLNQETYRSGGKAAAGAIIGGLLTGGIGLIAGAALGGRRRVENQLHLVVNHNGTPTEVFFKPGDKMRDLYTAFTKIMEKQTQAPAVIEEKPAENGQGGDLAKQIQDLHTLVEKGILTQEEFEAKKKKLLG